MNWISALWPAFRLSSLVGLGLAMAVAGSPGLVPSRCFGAGATKVCLFVDAALMAPGADSLWNTGAPQDLAAAQLRMVGPRAVPPLVVSPLARLDDSVVVQGRTFGLLTESDAVGFGSYTGLFTRPFTVTSSGVQFVRDVAGVEIRLLTGLKSGWVAEPNGFRSVLCRPDFSTSGSSGQPDSIRFVVTYRRSFPVGGKWVTRETQKPGFWESDFDFPDAARFPPPRLR